METTHDAYEFDERRVHRRARLRADERMRLADELLRYVLATTLLVILVRPIGVIVGLLWGLRIVRRLYRRELEPSLRRHMLRHELRRCRRRGAATGDGARRVIPEDLVARMGDDPRARSSRDWARSALAELDASDGPTGREIRVHVSDLVDDVVDAFEDQARRAGVSFRVDIDAEGEVEGDPDRLKALLLDLLGESVRSLQHGARGPGRIHVEMGENLAGSEVWVRIRDDRVDAATGARGTYGSRPVAGVPGATLETHASTETGVERILTLRKQPFAQPTAPNEPEPAPTPGAA
jgi:signal transduction histidine kinase